MKILLMTLGLCAVLVFSAASNAYAYNPGFAPRTPIYQPEPEPKPIPFVCSATKCFCWGDADCNDLMSSDLCYQIGPIVIGECHDDGGGLFCECERW